MGTGSRETLSLLVALSSSKPLLEVGRVFPNIEERLVPDGL
jgi:hypothetical protein